MEKGGMSEKKCADYSDFASKISSIAHLVDLPVKNCDFFIAMLH